MVTIKLYKAEEEKEPVFLTSKEEARSFKEIIHDIRAKIFELENDATEIVGAVTPDYRRVTYYIKMKDGEIADYFYLLNLEGDLNELD